MNNAAAVSNRSPQYVRGVVLVVAAGICWSIAGVVIRLTENVSEWQILFYRSLFLVATLLIYIAYRNKGRVWGAFRQAGAPACVAGAFLSVGFASWIFAITHTTVANALFVLSSASFIAALLGRNMGSHDRHVYDVVAGPAV